MRITITIYPHCCCGRSVTQGRTGIRWLPRANHHRNIDPEAEGRSKEGGGTVPVPRVRNFWVTSEHD